jgi:SAM-dependent methyltransferase
MSGFAAEWLAIREPADRRSRNREICAALKDYFADRSAITIVDLGCGTGANFCALQPELAARQEWRLVDHDSTLLAAARTAIEKFEPSSATGLRFVQADLAADLEQLVDAETDLVTAAALFDLVSSDWLVRLTKILACRSLPLYAVLTYNGVSRWLPGHSADSEILAAFHCDQRRDKGFGPAAGPAAASILCDLLRAHGYHVLVGYSPWQLTAADAALIARLVDGIVDAVAPAVAPEKIASWRKACLINLSCEIGHTDLFAFRAAG